MISFKGNFTQSAVNSSTNESAVTFGTDIKNSNVFLSTDIKVKPGVAFSKLMLVLGRIVRMRDAGVNKDHSAYQEWVQGEYFKELPSLMSSQLKQLPKLIKERIRNIAGVGFGKFHDPTPLRIQFNSRDYYNALI